MEWRERNPNKQKKIYRDYMDSHPLAARRNLLKSKYGMSVTDYSDLLGHKMVFVVFARKQKPKVLR